MSISQAPAPIVYFLTWDAAVRAMRDFADDDWVWQSPGLGFALCRWGYEPRHNPNDDNDNWRDMGPVSAFWDHDTGEAVPQ